MNTLQIVRRLRAFEEGQPLPHGETLHFPIADPADILVVSFVRMGGESSPWGVAWGRPDRPPQIAAVGEPRNRDFVADMLTDFAPTLLKHLFHPSFAHLQITQAEDPRPLRQVWLPNSTHLEMLHLLEYAYSSARFGDPARAELLRTFGRGCGWLFRESQRPGQSTAMVATEALRESFVFPSEDSRQGHLGFLLAWLRAVGDRSSRLSAARHAERLSVATSLDPELERSELDPRVRAFNALRGKDASALARAENAVRELLRPELARRFDLTAQAIDVMRRDKRRLNRGLDRLIKESNTEHWSEYLRLEHRLRDADGQRVFTPSPETDHNPSIAAARFYAIESSSELKEALLLHDDAELLEEAVAAGEAVRGRIVEIRDEGEGKKTRPVWVIQAHPGSVVRFREGSSLCVHGLPKRKVRVRSLLSDSRGIELEVAVTGLLTKNGKDLPAGTSSAADPALRGTTITLVKDFLDGIDFLKRRKLWTRGTPGAWLTGARPAERDVVEEIVDPASELVMGAE